MLRRKMSRALERMFSVIASSLATKQRLRQSRAKRSSIGSSPDFRYPNMASPRNNVAGTLHAYNQQRVNSLAGSAIFVKVKERCKFRHPNKVWTLNLQSSAIG